MMVLRQEASPPDLRLVPDGGGRRLRGLTASERREAAALDRWASLTAHLFRNGIRLDVAARIADAIVEEEAAAAPARPPGRPPAPYVPTVTPKEVLAPGMRRC